MPMKVQEEDRLSNLSAFIRKMNLIVTTSKVVTNIKLDDVCIVLSPEAHAYSSLRKITEG